MPDVAFDLEIITPDGVFLRSPATMVELPATPGRIGVLAAHERLVTPLETGELLVHRNGKTDFYFIGGGFAKIQPLRVSVLAIGIRQEIDAEALEGCCARARELLGDSYDLEAMESACERAKELLARKEAGRPAPPEGDLARYANEVVYAEALKNLQKRGRSR